MGEVRTIFLAGKKTGSELQQRRYDRNAKNRDDLGFYILQDSEIQSAQCTDE